MSSDSLIERANNAISVKTPAPDNYRADVASYAKNMKQLDRTSEQGFVNENGSSIALKADGSVRLAASEKAAFNLTPNGQSVEIALEKRTIANRVSYDIDDLAINGHKLNPFLYEMTDLRQVLHKENTAVADFTIMGTVLAKAWEPDLKRYVMIRRLVRTPMFSSTLNVPEIPKSMNISDPTLRNKSLTVDLPQTSQSPASTAKTAANTTPQASNSTSQPVASTSSQNVAEGTVWNSWEEQPPQAPAGYMWHRQENGTLILKKEYGA